NLIRGKASGGEVHIGKYSLGAEQLDAQSGNVTIGVRPEAWRIVSQEDGGLPVQVAVVEELGADGFVYGSTDVEGTPHDLTIRVNARDSVRKGDTVYVTTDPHQVHVFDSESGERLSA
ncbi:MAG TPA: TOBE domain-containing protein, partial [Kineosporiaceae bacterium]